MTSKRRAAVTLPGNIVIGAVAALALVGLEAANVGTTYAALNDVLGSMAVGVLPLAWALSVGLSALDTAGLLRLFWPELPGDRAIIYLMGAWLVAGTLNALGTWYAVTLALGERAAAGQPLEWAPAVIAVGLWLARILFIAAWAVNGGYLFRLAPVVPWSAARPGATPMSRKQLQRPAAPRPTGTGPSAKRRAAHG